MTDRAVVERTRAILLNAADGRRSLSDDRQYPTLRKELLRREVLTPGVVSTHPTVDSFSADLKERETRRNAAARVREEFAVALGESETPSADPSSWTGVESRAARLQAVREILPLAQASVEGLIAALGEPGNNGGPLLDGREEAIDNLRHLHRALGDMLEAVDKGHFDDELGQGLAAEVARYAKRAARELRGDPMPYIASALILGMFNLCGFPGIADYVAGLAAAVGRNAGRPKSRPQPSGTSQGIGTNMEQTP